MIVLLGYGLDCELVQTWNGLEVARVSLLGMNFLDTFVLPQYEIVSLNTTFTGITEKDLSFGPSGCYRYEGSISSDHLRSMPSSISNLSIRKLFKDRTRRPFDRFA
ncbi:unnamed protein product [Caenorhabditis nigoni]